MILRLRLFTSSTAFCVSLLLSACGGGSSSSTSNTNNNAVAVSLPPSAASLNDSNVLEVVVNRGPSNNVNIPYVSVTVCTPGGIVGSSQCKTIDNVLLDTGSTGLRLFATQVKAAPALTLPPQFIGSISAISECANFLNNNAWGNVKLADVVLGGERAASVPVQLMDANDAGSVKCTSAPLFASASDAPKTNTQLLGANGILGLSLFVNDGQSYFNCTQPGSLCQAISAPASKQLQNPVHLFSASSANGVANNNGVVLQLPSLPANGAPSAHGYLIFGVNTQTNNRLGTANVVPVNASGLFTTVYRGSSMTRSFMDSGSNGLYFTDPTPSVLAGTCNAADAGFYCPGATQNLSATIALASTSVTVYFSIANADTLFGTSGNYAFDNLGGTMGNRSFDWGLPFFFGRSVYTLIEGGYPNAATGALPLPFYAFTN